MLNRDKEMRHHAVSRPLQKLRDRPLVTDGENRDNVGNNAESNKEIQDLEFLEQYARIAHTRARVALRSGCRFGCGHKAGTAEEDGCSAQSREAQPEKHHRTSALGLRQALGYLTCVRTWTVAGNVAGTGLEQLVPVGVEIPQESESTS
jgi:hypothetical protein